MLLTAPRNTLYTNKIFIKHPFQFSHNCFSQIFNLVICLFRCLCGNSYLSILLQSSVLMRIVSFDIWSIRDHCLKTFSNLTSFVLGIFLLLWHCQWWCCCFFCLFFSSFYDDEFCISFKVFTIWAKMLFYKYFFVVIHKFAFKF